MLVQLGAARNTSHMPETPVDNTHFAAIRVAFYKRENYFRAVLSTDPVDPSTPPEFMSLESDRADMSNDEERRSIVQIFMDCLARVMQQKVFPQDTAILEIEEIGGRRVLKSATFPDGTVALRREDSAAGGVTPAAPATQ